MIELGQLERERAEFARRNTKVVVISIEDQKTARLTQADFPHLVVVADEDRQFSEAVEVIHRQSNPQGGDTAAPTTLLIDGSGTVRWTFRPDLFLERLSPTQVLAAIDEHMTADK